MHHPTHDPSTRRPAPSPGTDTFGQVLVVNALVAAGVLAIAVLASYPLALAGFTTGLLVVSAARLVPSLARRLDGRPDGGLRQPRPAR